MHDVLAHKVTLISLHAGGLEVNAGAGPERVESEAALIRATAQQALEELRKILGVLREPTEDIEEYPDLRRLVESWSGAGAVVTLDGDLDRLPAAAARAAYRLVQEGLTNAHKHASGAPVAVSVTGSPGDGVTISVVNEAPPGDGMEFPSSGVGLVGLAERFQLIGGTVRGGPGDAGGWRLEGHLPWLADAADSAPGEPHDQNARGRR
jgi:signal transduction histidine kinase